MSVGTWLSIDARLLYFRRQNARAISDSGTDFSADCRGKTSLRQAIRRICRYFDYQLSEPVFTVRLYLYFSKNSMGALLWWYDDCHFYLQCPALFCHFLFLHADFVSKIQADYSGRSTNGGNRTCLKQKLSTKAQNRKNATCKYFWLPLSLPLSFFCSL